MNQILYSRKKEKKAQRLAIALGALFMLAILVSVIFYIININNEKILSGVFINNLNVGGLTKEEATSKFNEEMDLLRDKEVVLKIGEQEFKYTYKDLGLSYTSNLITRAYEYGRSGNIIADNYTILSSYLGKEHNISEEIDVEASRLDVIALEMLEGFENSTVNDSYTVEDNKIVITKGHDGVSIKVDELKKKIEEIANNKTDDNTIEVPADIGKANRIDIEELYKEIYIEKVEASYKTGETFEVIKEVEGRYFDKQKAKEAYDAAKDDESSSNNKSCRLK